MPTPMQNETKEEYMQRCIPMVQEDGSTKDANQAIAMCQSMWEQGQEQNAAENDRELRSMKVDCMIEERDGGKKVLTGYAAVFNEETTVGNMFREMIMPGAFAESLQQDSIRSLFNHNPDKILGRSSKNMRIWEDVRGLAYEVDLLNTETANEVRTWVETGLVDGASFSFFARGKDREQWERGKDGQLDLRRIVKAKLFDIGPVTFPQYDGTTAQMRSEENSKRAYDDWKKQKPPEEKPRRHHKLSMKLSLRTKEV